MHLSRLTMAIGRLHNGQADRVGGGGEDAETERGKGERVIILGF